jgi:uncharacterized protein (TIRG00374 family)
MKTLCLIAAKIVLTIGLFALALRSIHIGEVWAQIKILPALAGLTVIILFIAQMVIAAARLSAIANIVSSAVLLTKAFRINWVGSFFSQALVTFVSGDVVRAMMLNRSCGITMRDSIGAITLDRIVGLLSSLVIVSLTAPWAVGLTSNETMRRSIVVLAVMGVLLVVGFAAAGYLARHPELVQIVRAKIRGSRIAYILLDVMSVARHLFNQRRQIPKILVTSFLIQIINVAIIFVLINGMGAEVSIWQCMLIVPTVMLISLLPFSVAGWGLRESAMATGFSLVHAPPASALAASLIYGILTLVLALPGGVLWWSSGTHIPKKS